MKQDDEIAAKFEPEWQAIVARDMARESALAISTADLRGALASVKHDHDPDAAMALIQYFHGKFSAGDPCDEQILYEYIEHAFGRIVAGVSADAAFGFKRVRGERDRIDTTGRDVVTAAFVVLLIRKNWKWLDAVEEVAILIDPGSKGTRWAVDAYSKYKEALSSVASPDLAEMVPEELRSNVRDLSV